jgi:hypothetical protein
MELSAAASDLRRRAVRLLRRRFAAEGACACRGCGHDITGRDGDTKVCILVQGRNRVYCLRCYERGPAGFEPLAAWAARLAGKDLREFRTRRRFVALPA